MPPSQAAAVSIRRSSARAKPPEAAKWFMTISVPPGLKTRQASSSDAIRTGNDAHHIRRERDVKRRVRKFERSGVHDMEPPNLRQPFSIDPRVRRPQHRRRNIDAGHKHVAREKRQFEPGADADNEDRRPVLQPRPPRTRPPPGPDGTADRR